MLSVYVVAELRVTVKYMYTKILSVVQECFYGKFFTSNYANVSCYFSEINYMPRNLHFFHTLNVNAVPKLKNIRFLMTFFRKKKTLSYV
jgi:hypothetical protein